MTAPFLATKLYVPPLRPGVILRPRLLARLGEGLHRRLTPVSAPAGFGKTTLVSAWLAGDPARPQEFPALPAAWLSLDEGDKDPTRFLAYLIAALQTLAPHLGEGLLAVLGGSQPPPVEAVLAALVNEIAAIRRKLVLVLDDYHLVDAPAVDHALAFLLEHLPPVLHLVITTREDPPLPLPRLRARGQLTELRAADLRFTAAEAAEFLDQVMGLRLAPEAVEALETHTEGWIAGLQLAALSLQGREDVAGFVKAFAGDHRYIVDYLVEEVLQRQPQHVRSFLLQTSILDRLCGPLCDAVTNQHDGMALLNALERSNLFVVPLDDKRHWFRYHHLFADVLRMHLLAEQAGEAPALHRRASAWYAQHGAPDDAIYHALAGEDFAAAAALIELAIPAMRRSRQDATLLRWLQALPDEIVRRRPVLSVQFAGPLLVSGDIAGAASRLQDAARWLDTAPGSSEPALAGPDNAGPDNAEMVVVDHAEFRRLPAWLAIYRAAIALAQGDVPATVQYAGQARDRVVADDPLGRGAAAGFLGLAAWTAGELDAAHAAYVDCMAGMLKASYVADALGSAITLADIRIAQGRLHDAMRHYAQGLQLAGDGEPPLRGTADLHVGMSELYLEHNDLAAARQHLLRAEELGEFAGLPQNRHRRHVAEARLAAAEGDLHGALDQLDAAARLYVRDFTPNLRPIAALQARVWVAQARLGEAIAWADAQGLSPQDELSYLREFEHITLARILLAQAQGGAHDALLAATGLLARLLQAAQAGGRTAHTIEILLLQALAHHSQGDIPAALIPLQHALALAEPQGYVRIFVDEGPPMAHLLAAAGDRGIMPAYAGALLAELEPAAGADQPRRVVQAPLPAAAAAPRLSEPLLEPLSERELQVLRLFKSELSGPEIAAELVVALSTVRTHTKHIFGKLNVNSRPAAVRRAAELGLL